VLVVCNPVSSSPRSRPAADGLVLGRKNEASWQPIIAYCWAVDNSILVDCNRAPFPPQFKPLEQLMGVFPAGSKQHVPPTWQDLMTNPQSPIIDFYPTNFKIDLNGKKYAWQGKAFGISATF